MSLRSLVPVIFYFKENESRNIIKVSLKNGTIFGSRFSKLSYYLQKSESAKQAVIAFKEYAETFMAANCGNEMIKPLSRLSRLLARFWYPVTLPEDVAETLGVEVSNFLSFDDLMKCLAKSNCNPLRLAKFMPRKDAEAAFKHATCIEHFGEKTLVSYFFPEGWVEFILKFDRESRLRRIYLLHKDIEDEGGVEINLCCSYIGNRLHHKSSIERTLSVG